MRIAFLASDKAREQLLADAFLMGARRHGHTTEVIALTGEPTVGAYDVACMCGVKSRELFQAHRRAGIAVIYLDKGYTRMKRLADARGWEYWRVSVNEHHPTRRLAALALPADRLAKLDVTLKPWRAAGRHLVFAGSSAKYHDFYGLRDPNDYARKLIREALRYSSRTWVYRPKPSWEGGHAVANARFSGPTQSIGDVLTGAWALVTHGSNACFEAVCEGIPCVVLGNAVALPLSSTELRDLDKPRLASDAERRQWLANLSYFQYTLAEMSQGVAWEFLGSEIHA